MCNRPFEPNTESGKVLEVWKTKIQKVENIEGVSAEREQKAMINEVMETKEEKKWRKQ
jgi:hypothetical protein